MRDSFIPFDSEKWCDIKKCTVARFTHTFLSSFRHLTFHSQNQRHLSFLCLGQRTFCSLKDPPFAAAGGGKVLNEDNVVWSGTHCEVCIKTDGKSSAMAFTINLQCDEDKT